MQKIKKLCDLVSNVVGGLCHCDDEVDEFGNKPEDSVYNTHNYYGERVWGEEPCDYCQIRILLDEIKKQQPVEEFIWPLPDGVEIIHSTLTIPDPRDEFDSEVATFKLASGLSVDIMWDNKEKLYYLTVYYKDFNNNVISSQSFANYTDMICGTIQAWETFKVYQL